MDGNPLQQFIRFSVALPYFSKNMQSTISYLKLENVEEGLYTRVSDAWLSMILKQCPQLSRMELINVSFLTDSCVQYYLTFSISSSITHLNITQAVNLSTNNGWLRLLPLFPLLRRLHVHSCSGFRDPVVSVLPNHFPSLTHLDIINCHSLTDSGFIAFATALYDRKIRICCLNLSETSISDVALMEIIRAVALTLVDVYLRQCHKLTNNGVLSALAIHGLQLKTLDISQNHHISSLILFYVPRTIEHLSLSHDMIQQDPVAAHNAIVSLNPLSVDVFDVKESELCIQFWLDLCHALAFNVSKNGNGRKIIRLWKTSWTSSPDYSGHETREDLKALLRSPNLVNMKDRHHQVFYQVEINRVRLQLRKQ